MRAFLPIHVIDIQTNTKIDEIMYPSTPGNYLSAIAISPNGQYLYLLDTVNDELVILSPAEKALVKKLPLRA